MNVTLRLTLNPGFALTGFRTTRPRLLTPFYICLVLSRYNLRRNDDSAVLLTFPTIRTKNSLADRSFSCAAPRLWNLLQIFLKLDLKRFFI